MENENVVDHEAIASQIIADAKDLKGAVGSKKMGDINTLLPIVVKAVEAKSLASSMSSEDKKGVAVAILSKLVKVPGIPDELKPLVIGRLVDGAIAVANKLFGKKWFQKAS